MLSTTAVDVTAGEPIVLGALDSSLINAVINEDMAKIKYCYQHILDEEPNLGPGKIVMKFVIHSNGSVKNASVKASTVNNFKVESCIKNKFLQFKFSKTAGGGIVIVSYPLIFTH